MSTEKIQHIIIVGGGFGGIRTALDLHKNASENIRITLISQNKCFEYYPGLHHLIGDSTGHITSIPLIDIFEGTRVELVHETVVHCEPSSKSVITHSGKEFKGDTLVLALGSQTEYFNIKGLQEASFGLKSVEGALHLRKHIDGLFEKHKQSDREEKIMGLHMVVVGAGPAGVDLAGELAVYGNKKARSLGIDPSFVTIDLIESGSRVLAMMDEKISHKVQHRLQTLGVHVFLNRDLVKEGSWTIFLKDMTIGAKTLIWTAGIKAHDMYQKISGITFGKKGRVIVDEYLQAQGHTDVFIIGDGADTPYAGLAQTALYDGAYVAQIIMARLNGNHHTPYTPRSVAYNIGVGPRWSVFVYKKFIMTGRIASWLRQLIDFRFFISILPFKKVIALYRTSYKKKTDICS